MMTHMRVEQRAFPAMGENGAAVLTADMRKAMREKTEELLGPCREEKIVFHKWNGLCTVDITYVCGEDEEGRQVPVFGIAGDKVMHETTAANDGGEIRLGGTRK